MCPQCLPKYSRVTSKGVAYTQKYGFYLEQILSKCFPSTSMSWIFLCRASIWGSNRSQVKTQEDTRKCYKTISKARQIAGIQDCSIIIIVLTSFRAVGVRTLLVLKIATSTLSLFLKWVSNQACK